jgi:hypothetical protein
LVKQIEGVLDGVCAFEEAPTVGKRVRGDVDHTHDQGVFPKGQRALADVPLKDGAHQQAILIVEGR